MPIYQDKKIKLYKYRTYIKNVDGTITQKQKNGFKTKKEARNAEKKLLLENEKYLDRVLNEERNINSIISFEDLWNEYNSYIKLKLKPNSYRSVKNRITNHILPYFKRFNDLNEIKARDYVKWQEMIDEKEFGYSYKKSLHTAMVTLLNYAIKFCDLKENIASKIGNFKNNKSINKNVDFWTYEEFTRFIDVVDDKIDKLLFKTLYFTGMRVGECLALTWNDLENDYIKISKTISKEKINGERVITSPKTKSSNRKILLDDEVLNELLEYKTYCEKKIHFDKKWFIFGDLKPLSPTTIERHKNNYCDKAGVKKIRIHDFRHSHASLLISRGVPITVVQARLGHSNPSITLQIYSHMMPNDDYKAIKAINALKPTSAS